MRKYLKTTLLRNTFAYAFAFVFVFACIAFAFVSAESIFADSEELTGKAVFTGSGIQSDFDSEEMAHALSDMQPGDEMTVLVTYRNNSKKKTDWYMENEVLKTLEKANKAKGTPDGTGNPENGGYRYVLTLIDMDDNETVLYSNERVGGDAKADGLEGLEQATNALKNWFYLNSLEQNEEGKVRLDIKLDGETEVNDYMGTDGEVMMRFATDYSESDKPPVPEKDDEPEYTQIKTGDSNSLILYAALLFAGVILMAAAIVMHRRKEGEK